MNTCYQSDIAAPVTLPAIGTKGDYVLPSIEIKGEVLAKEQRFPAEVIGHIGAFGLRLQETGGNKLAYAGTGRFQIETHFTSFEPTA